MIAVKDQSFRTDTLVSGDEVFTFVRASIVSVCAFVEVDTFGSIEQLGIRVAVTGGASKFAQTTDVATSVCQQTVVRYWKEKGEILFIIFLIINYYY